MKTIEDDNKKVPVTLRLKRGTIKKLKEKSKKTHASQYQTLINDILDRAVG